MEINRRIERFLRTHDMPPTVFGRQAVRDPRLVLDMRRGRCLGAGMAARAEAFMLAYEQREKCPLVAALLAMLPGAVRQMRDEQAWHSMGLSGERVMVTLGLAGTDIEARTRDFTAVLPEAEFDIGPQFVADIYSPAVRINEDSSATIEIEALLLEC